MSCGPVWTAAPHPGWRVTSCFPALVTCAPQGRLNLLCLPLAMPAQCQPHSWELMAPSGTLCSSLGVPGSGKHSCQPWSSAQSQSLPWLLLHTSVTFHQKTSLDKSVGDHTLQWTRKSGLTQFSEQLFAGHCLWRMCTILEKAVKGSLED